MEWVDRYVNFLLMRSKTFNNQCAHPIETNQVIWSANQLTGFYMMGRLVVKGLNMCNVCPEAVVRRCSVKTVFFKIPQNFTGKHLCQSLFFNKVAGLWSATLLKKWLMAKIKILEYRQNFSGAYGKFPANISTSVQRCF